LASVGGKNRFGQDRRKSGVSILVLGPWNAKRMDPVGVNPPMEGQGAVPFLWLEVLRIKGREHADLPARQAIAATPHDG
jgi:hypothetical protein